MDLPDEIWIRIILELQRSSDNWKSAIQILHNTMNVNRFYRDICRDWEIWQAVAKRFTDYTRLCKRHLATNNNWYDIIKERTSEIFIQREILVGDRTSPESRYLIQIHGNGDMYIGHNITEYHAAFLHIFRDFTIPAIHDAIAKYNNVEYIMSPYSKYLKVVDISVYDPFMIILTEDNEVIEFIFKPSWDTKWDEFNKPRAINFPNEVVIEKIFAMDYANMAIGDGYVWAWTVFDNPIGTVENISTPPLNIKAIGHMYIYYIERHDIYTRMYYVLRNTVDTDSMLKYKSPFKDDIINPDALYIDIENTQIIALIADTIFTGSEISEIAEKIKTAENA